jgi:hypothetical protein
MLDDAPGRVVDSGLLGAGEDAGDEARETARERARQLYDTLNRTEYIDFDEVPGPEHAQPSWTWRGSPPGHPSTVVRIRFEATPEVGWRISDESAARIPDLWQSVKDLQTLEIWRENLPLLVAARCAPRPSCSRTGSGSPSRS